ncbi:uncharacterized protein HMPREF1541_04554 [Cyphellophora europaea CBS 101466]|uniref:Derlin n=1 Tax=Cyphellophora europaea (strain CBS 101466) TaxID=1220924 RepID=W2RWW5_CYPE1|nr:uncharacterized protein HMPREF1541_04554 [Cyphellophora europaea CBS 101466]ETN40278.1 hypothetical protein HMPREF1541_04554 [Cyphellophora europaea CBS 101466]
MDRFWSAPPVSRTIVAVMGIESLLVIGGIMPIYWVHFEPSLMWKLPPHVWRLASSFLLTGGGLSFIFDLYFTWIYGTGLELNSPRFSQPGDFFVYVVFNMLVILATAGFLLKAYIFTSALIMAFIYTFSQDNRGTKAHFVIFQIPVELLPWATLALTLVLAGPGSAAVQGMGIISAHLYDFLTRLYPTFQGGSNWVQTPMFVKRAFGADRTSFAHKKYGTSVRPGQPIPQQQSRGWTSGFSGGGWSGRGQGHRLGNG